MKLPYRSLVAILGISLIESSAATAQSPIDFDLQKVADGVYVAVQRQVLGDPIDGNSTIIINDDDVVVVDTKETPESARQLIKAIKKLTSKPVRYVVTTHFHRDHHYGNDEFLKAYPGVEIVAQKNTFTDMMAQDNPTILADIITNIYPKIIADRQANQERVLKRGTYRDGRPLPATIRDTFAMQNASMDWLLGQLKQVTIRPATMLVGDRLTLRRGRRTIDIRYLGLANTRGDLVVVLPEDSVVITGDVLVNPIPFAFGSTFGSWITVLDSIRAMPMKTIVPGHGSPQHDFVYLDQVRALFQTTLDQAKAAVAAGKDLAGTKAAVKLDSMKAVFIGPHAAWGGAFDQFFIAPGVERAFIEASGKPPAR